MDRSMDSTANPIGGRDVGFAAEAEFVGERGETEDAADAFGPDSGPDFDSGPGGGDEDAPQPPVRASSQTAAAKAMAARR